MFVSLHILNAISDGFTIENTIQCGFFVPPYQFSHRITLDQEM